MKFIQVLAQQQQQWEQERQMPPTKPAKLKPKLEKAEGKTKLKSSSDRAEKKTWVRAAKRGSPFIVVVFCLTGMASQKSEREREVLPWEMNSSRLLAFCTTSNNSNKSNNNNEQQQVYWRSFSYSFHPHSSLLLLLLLLLAEWAFAISLHRFAVVVVVGAFQISLIIMQFMSSGSSVKIVKKKERGTGRERWRIYMDTYVRFDVQCTMCNVNRFILFLRISNIHYIENNKIL